MRNLTGKRVLITGAGQGLGRELASNFAAAGAQIIATDSRPDTLSETVRILQDKGAQVSAYVMDVTDPNAVGDVRDRIHQEHGPLDVLVNNAAIVHGGAFLDVPVEGHVATYEVNATGPMIVTH